MEASEKPILPVLADVIARGVLRSTPSRRGAITIDIAIPDGMGGYAGIVLRSEPPATDARGGGRPNFPEPMGKRARGTPAFCIPVSTFVIARGIAI